MKDEIRVDAGVIPAAIDDRSPARSGVLAAVGRGAWAGARGTARVVAPFAGLALLGGLCLTAFGVGSGRGWGLSRIVPGTIAAVVGLATFGVLIGAAAGLVVGLLGRGRPATSPAAWSGAIRLPWRRRSEGLAPPRRRRRWPWLVGMAALLALQAAWVAGIYVGRLVDRRLAEAIAAADRDDPAWRLNDLLDAREVVPDDENSAHVVADVLDRLPPNWPAGSPLPLEEPLPPASELSEACERLGAAAANVRLDEATADTLRPELAAHPEAVAIARTIADCRRGRHELEIGPTVFDTSLDETQAARVVARFLQVDAAILAHDGDLDAALDSCRAILGVARSIGDEPFLISQLVRVAIGGVAMKSSHRVLGQGEPSAAALARFQGELLDELAEPLLLHGVRGERAALDAILRGIREGELPISLRAEDIPPNDGTGPPFGMAPWGRLMFDSQRAYGLAWMNAAVAIARRPDVEQPALASAWEGEIDRVRDSWHGTYSATLPVLLSPSFPAAVTMQLRHRAALGTTVVAIAAERSRRRTGHWPASVSAIDAAILPTPPRDPFSGSAYRLEASDGQLRVYSIGPDGRDDHGAFDPKRRMLGGPDDINATLWDVPLRRRVE